MNEWALLDDIRKKINDDVPEIKSTIVAANEMLLPESFPMPACLIKRGNDGLINWVKGGYREEYSVEIWLYAEDFTDRESATKQLMDLSSILFDIFQDYEPVNGTFLMTYDPIILGPIVSVIDTETGEFFVRRMIEIKYKSIIQ